MLTLHHLEYSRSIRILWLLEELGMDYELVRYPRDENFKAPPALAKVHPLGKSPVVVDGELVIAESSAILRHINQRYGNGDFTPPAGSDAATLHDEWLDYVESSAALPIMIKMLGERTGGLSEGMKAFIAPQIEKTMAYITSGIGDGPFLLGNRLTLADIQMSYMLAVAQKVGLLEQAPVVGAYFQRLQQQPGFLRAVERGGPMMPSAQ